MDMTLKPMLYSLSSSNLGTVYPIQSFYLSIHSLLSGSYRPDLALPCYCYKSLYRDSQHTWAEQTSKKQIKSSTDFSVVFPNVFSNASVYYMITSVQQTRHNTVFREFTVYPGRYDVRSWKYNKI